MSTHRSVDDVPVVEVRVLDPGGQQLAFTWQIRDGHGRPLAEGRVAGAPNTPEFAGWRYQAFTEAAEIAIAALQDLEATDHTPSVSDGPPGAAIGEQEHFCNFCAAPSAIWRYPARPDPIIVRVQDALVLLHGGDWHACPACYLLVEAGKWDALSERARLPLDQGEALWATFRAHRTGEAQPLDPEGRADA